MPLHLSKPDTEALARGTPFLRLLAEAAQELGGRIEMDRNFGFVGRYTPPGGAPGPVFGKALGLNSDASAALAADKEYTATWLAAEGLPTPRGGIFFSQAYRDRMALRNRSIASRLPGAEAARSMAAMLGFPVIAKPNAGSEGEDVHRCESPEDLDRDLAALLTRHDRIRMEQCVAGRDYRLLVLEGDVVLAYERRPLSVTGDGARPLSSLIEAALARLADRHRGCKIAGDDPRIARTLATAGLALDTVIAQGERVALLGNANLSTGGDLVDLTDVVPNAARRLAVRAARSLGLRLAGVDLMAPDLLAQPEAAVILEVNSAPGLDYYASESQEHFDRARAIVRRMLTGLG
ncbi:RimK-like ATP-grasp domain-containing protein [Aliiruegeria haliotis]|uniref:RimK-like ATP-grasp domain-containing protein n=1 Tax=Aliiruegeria haliotis TaxID=1280846 RepID=A0A2T0RRE3_9RHOB|nr:hypothetical protein [Aliiruegeria haliotis]PRY23775.1 RimK-like ATP-grasp domain-containing protein [Aliiruegeria haliotis]